MKRYSKKQKWLFGILIFVLLFATATTIANEIAANRGQELPGYEKKDIEGTVEKLSQGQTLTKEESTFLYEQTGLGEDAFMALADRGEASELLKYQDALFQKIHIQYNFYQLFSPVRKLLTTKRKIFFSSPTFKTAMSSSLPPPIL